MRTTQLQLAVAAVAGSLVLGACGGDGGGEPTSLTEDEVVTTTPPGDSAVDSLVWALPTGQAMAVDPIRGGGSGEGTVIPDIC